MINRILQTTILQALKKSKKSILLLGPRQTGKSTLMKNLNPDLTINLAREKEYRDHVSDPELIERIIKTYKDNCIVYIDEIQRIPEMLNTIQAIIDDNKNILFLLTGSSARKLKHGSANLLPGRILRMNLFPLTSQEIGSEFILEKALMKGMLPEIYLSENGDEILENYAALYLKEEIMAEALVRNYASFSKFLDIAAELSWQEFNYSKVSSDTEIPKESIRRYVEILEDTLIIHRISGFKKVHSNRKAIQKEKIIFFDIGVRNAVLGVHQNKLTSIEQGYLFEQFIVLELIAINSYFKKNWKLYYYRDQYKTEVDLIIEGPKDILAIEIKSGQKYRSDWRDALNNFAEVVEVHGKRIKKIIVYRGDHSQKDKDITIFPYQDFLSMMKEF